MEHVVFFPAPDGSPAFRRVPGLEDAVRLVEHLRNVEGVAEVTVHPIGDEVPLAFRTWYRVEVPAGEAAAPVVPQQASPASDVAQPPAPAASFEAAVVEPEPAPEERVAEPVSVQPEDAPADLAPAMAGESGPEGSADAPSANGHSESVKSLGFFAT